MVLGDLRIEELAAQRLEAFERAFLVRPHQPRIPRHIGGKDRSEPAGPAFGVCALARRWPEGYRTPSSGFGEQRSRRLSFGGTARTMRTLSSASSAPPTLA